MRVFARPNDSPDTTSFGIQYHTGRLCVSIVIKHGRIIKIRLQMLLILLVQRCINLIATVHDVCFGQTIRLNRFIDNGIKEPRITIIILTIIRIA